MGKSNPFKVGDRVYVYPHGWGKVTNDNELVAVQMDGHGPELLFVKEDWRLVSFTEYDPINGGLSHERPETKASCCIDGKDFILPPMTGAGTHFTPEEPFVELNYRRFINEALDIHDIIGFNLYKDVIETTDKKGGKISSITTDRVTLSIDLVRRK